VTLLPDVRTQVYEAAQRHATRRRRRIRPAHLVPVASLAVVIAVAAVFIGVHRSGRPGGSAVPGTVEVVFAAHPTPQAPVVTQTALSRTAEILRARLRAVFRDADVTTSGRSLIVIVRGPPSARAEVVSLARSSRLTFYDWEANALMPNGNTVARGLQTQEPRAIAISEGAGSLSAGGTGTGTGTGAGAGAGGMTLYDAVTLASKQPPHVSPDNSRLGSEYYAFSAPGGAACAAATRAHGAAPAPGEPCLVSGPDDNKHDLLKAVPPHATVPEVLAVPPGTVVLRAADPRMSPNDPRARYYVLRDHVALGGNDITDPRTSTDASGNPNVTFGFTSHGTRAFQRMTAAIAHRGDLVSGLGQTFNQHFAVALDGVLITVPQIDYKTYPDGIQGDRGADVSGGFTPEYARILAARMRLAALPLTLTPN
jgi:hypothetical protein